MMKRWAVPITRPRAWWRSLDDTTRKILYVLAIAALITALPAAALSGDWSGLFLNLGTELAGGAVTFVLLDQVLGTSRRKRELIAQMGSSVNDEAIRAVEDLRRHGWLTDGSLRGMSFVGANLKKAPLENAQLEQTNLMHVDFQDAILPRANLEGASLIKAKFNGANLVDAKLRRVHFLGADFQRADLNSADFTGAARDDVNNMPIFRELAALGTWERELVRGIWQGLTARETINFEGAALTRAIFEGADLTNAVFKDAILIKVNLTEAVLTGAKFDGADLTGATLPNGDKWYPGYDMTIFTNPPDGDASDR